MIKKLLLSSSAVVATLALTTGMAFAGSINTTGKGSVNVISNKNISLCSSVNNNNISVNTFTGQQAKSGSAKVTYNTVGGGNATSGPATNQNTTGVGLTVTNGNACAPQLLGASNVSGDPSIDTTGAKSLNVISSTNFSSVYVVNNNNTWVNTTTLQGAQSGNAQVSGNTVGGGNAKSGDGSNTNTTTVILDVQNN
jgi:hypothetical protein